MPRLTKRIVDAAKERDAAYFIWCSDLPGFGVRVFPSGKRVYYADYRNRLTAARKRMTLGHHGKLTTEEARDLAVVTLGGVLKGEDPAEERKTRRKSMRVAELCDTYLKAADKGLIMGKRRQPKKASTLATDKGRIERHIKPLLGSRLVADIKHTDITRFIRDVTTGKTAAVEVTKLRGKAVVEGGKGAAARTAGLLGGILSFAVSEGVIPFNPSRGIKRPADERRERRLTADDYRALGQALAVADDERLTQQAIDGTWLVCLTGCRVSEIAGLQWSEVDIGGSCLRLADSKEGASVRPIGSPAIEVLSRITRAKDESYVLPAVRGGGPFNSLGKGLIRLTKRAGLDGVTAHTLRHSFASVANDLGFTESTIGALIGHSANTITSRYVHHLDAVMIAAADKVAREVRQLMD